MKIDSEYLRKGYTEMHEVRMKYAHLIAKRNGGIGWPYGWTPIVRQIFELCDSKGYKIAVVQIKEKFGGLRFYYDLECARDAEIDHEICKLEDLGMITCDLCGEAGERGNSKSGWIVTRCKEHKETKYPDQYANGLYDLYSQLDQEFYLRLQQVGVSEKEGA